MLLKNCRILKCYLPKFFKLNYRKFIEKEGTEIKEEDQKPNKKNENIVNMKLRPKITCLMLHPVFTDK
jgi:hypothetical protein